MTYKKVTIYQTTMKSVFFAYLIAEEPHLQVKKVYFWGGSGMEKLELSQTLSLKSIVFFPVISLRFSLRNSFVKFFHRLDKKLSLW